jgi:hypothetical protein
MISRRDFLKMAGLGAGAAFLNACSAALSPTPAAAGLPTLAPVIATPARTATPRIMSPTPPATATTTPFALSDIATPYGKRLLCFVLWDHQLEQYGYRSRDPSNPVPETCPLRSGAVNPMTPAWTAYWKGILHLCNPAMDPVHFEHAWRSLTASYRAFTNFKGSETGDFSTHAITCGGATHEMVTGEPEGQYIRIYTLNWAKGPPPLPSSPQQIDMTRHFFATTGSNVKLADGSYSVYGFPQFENCIVPLISRDDTDGILAARVKPVDFVQRPYNP